MTETSLELQQLIDKAAIHEALIRYTNANDADDWAAMAACFAENGRFGSNVGRAALAESFSGMRTRARGMNVDAVDQGIHLLSNIEIKVDGDHAKSYCAAVVYLLAHRGEQVVLLVRGITYHDDFERTNGQWLIASRTHSLKWMYETTPTSPDAPVSAEPGAAGVR